VAAQLTDLAHELRTPLNSVIGLSAVLARGIHGPLNEKQSEYVAQIEASGRHLLALITDVLDFAKAESGKLDAQLEEVSVADVVDEVVAMMRGTGLARGVVVRGGHAPDLLPVAADPLRLKQVLLNLLSNAIKFTEPGQRVGVYAHARYGTVSIDVWDTGIGIAAEDQERIFQPFEQVDAARSRRDEGTGLGLPLSRRLTEAQGGTLSVHSALGYGSVFTVSFPALAAGQDAAPPLAPPVALPQLRLGVPAEAARAS
jgi:signal transduction histidine kinase